MQQPIPNPEDITDPTTAMNMALALMAKAFKLNYSTPTNNNQRKFHANPRNRQIAQPVKYGARQDNADGGANVQNVGNQVVQDAVQNQGVQNIGNQNGQIGVQNIGNGNVVAARAEGNAPGNNGNQIRCYNCRGLGHLARNPTPREEFDLMAAAADLDEIEEVNANCILMANLQQASTSSTQTDKAPVYDSDGSAEVHNYDNCYDNEIFNMFTQEEQYTEILEPIPEPHQVQQNDNVISDISNVEQEGGTVDQHTATIEETRAFFESLYNNLAIEVEKVNSINRKMKETNVDLTTELGRYKNQEKCFEISQKKYDKLERCYQKSVYQEQCLTKKINALHLSSEKKKLKSDFKIREDELLDKQIQLENKFLGTVRFGNDHVAAILGFGDLQWGNILITRVYFVEGLGHNLFSVGQFCDSDLEVAFRRNTCFVRTLEGVDLLKGNRSTNLYTINLHEMASASPICLMARATSTKSWLWHQRLSHLNFDTINDLAKNDLVTGLPKFKYHKEHLCPSCEQGKSKRASHPPKPVPNSKQRLHLLHMDCCAMAFEQSSSKPGPQSMTSGQISSGLDLTYAPSTITTQKPTEGELDLLFEAMYDDYIGGQPSSAPRTAPDAQAPQALQTPTATTTTADTAPTPTNSSSQATNCPNSSQDVDELETQQHGQHQPATIADNVPNAMFDENTFVNPFATPSTSDAASSSSQYVDPSNMHTFYQPYPHEFQWTKDHPLEQVIGEPSRPVLTRNQLRSDGDMCMYALTVSTVEPKNVKEAMTDPAWIESMQEEKSFSVQKET
ncbi:retrovirus-related pol polyprotein from transposon TNT 1-94 [Tanacetum coccineum]